MNQTRICTLAKLMIKLRKANNRGYKTGKPTWKYLACLLKQLGHELQRKYYNTKVNNVLENNQYNWWNAGNEIASNEAPGKDMPNLLITIG